MNIDKAIEHAFEVSTTCENASCALEHVQLAFWLKQLKELQSILGYSYNLDRLKELADADKEGRCLVLPCKVGDTVYYIYKDCPKDYKPQYCTDHLGSCENCTHRVATILKTTFTLPMIDNVKNIYLTKQEAEKALEGLE